MNYFVKFLIAIVSVSATSAYAGIFENWNTSSLSAAGKYWSDLQSEATNITDPSKRWLVNTWQPECANNLNGPNVCYAPSNGRLYFHGEKGAKAEGSGDGVLLVSKDKMPIANGMIVEGSFRAYCTTSQGGCWVNIGIYAGEGNYRSIGYRSLGNNEAFFNIWGPTAESNFSGGQFTRIPLGQTVQNYKIQYWKKDGVWRWDFFLNNIWVAGHKVPDYEHKLGKAEFGSDGARIEIGYGGYQIGGASAEGHFETISYVTW